MRIFLVSLVLMMLSGCFLGGEVDERGDVVCKAGGVVVFEGRIRMTGEAYIDLADLPERWRIVGVSEDVKCDVYLDVVTDGDRQRSTGG